MFQKINIPRKNIVLKDDYYIKLFKRRLKQNNSYDFKIRFINFINSFLDSF